MNKKEQKDEPRFYDRSACNALTRGFRVLVELLQQYPAEVLALLPEGWLKELINDKDSLCREIIEAKVKDLNLDASDPEQYKFARMNCASVLNLLDAVRNTILSPSKIGLFIGSLRRYIKKVKYDDVVETNAEGKPSLVDGWEAVIEEATCYTCRDSHRKYYDLVVQHKDLLSELYKMEKTLHIRTSFLFMSDTLDNNRLLEWCCLPFKR